MRDYPTISKSNEPKELTAFDKANARAESELSGFGAALKIVEQKRTYSGGQMDLFPNELIDESVLFLAVVEEIK